jgi:hypothetical protein
MLPSCTQVVHQLSGEFRFPFVFLWTWLMKRPGCPHCKLTDQKSREHSGLLFFPLQTGHTIYKSTCVVPVLSLICSYKTVAHFPRAFYLILTNTFRFGPPCPHTSSATRVLELETPPFWHGPYHYYQGKRRPNRNVSSSHGFVSYSSQVGSAAIYSIGSNHSRKNRTGCISTLGNVGGGRGGDSKSWVSIPFGSNYCGLPSGVVHWSNILLRVSFKPKWHK